jgi:glycosyltransferase involved in cell wall biosynthesis
VPRVSVLVPVYNSAAYVQEALDSIGGQLFGDFELVVVDDGSTDGSTALLERFAAAEPRMRLISRPNRGLIATRNQLLDEAQGEFIAWMDSDDLSHPQRLQRQVAALDADQRLVCIGSNVQWIDPAGQPLGVEQYPEEDEAIRAEQRTGGGLRFGSTMIRRNAETEAVRFREPFRMAEDFDYLLRIGERGRLANVPEDLYVYRQHLLSTCTALGVDWPRYRQTILALAEERRERGSDKLERGEAVSVPAPKRQDVRRYRPEVLLMWARRTAEIGDRRRAVRYALNALRLAPAKLAAWKLLAKLLLLKDRGKTAEFL